MRIDWRELVAALLPGLWLAAGLVLAAVVGARILEPAQREALAAMLGPHAPLLVIAVVLLAVAGGTAMRWAWRHFGAAPARLAEAVQVRLSEHASPQIPVAGSAGSRALAAAVNRLATQRNELRQEIGERAAAASRAVEQERSRLAALMAELTQSVIVCNLDGRILLFNARAQALFRAPPEAPAIGGAEPLGLGRSLYALLDRRLVAHALEVVGEQSRRGAVQPTAQFVTATPLGQVLRVQLAPVRAPQEEAPGAGPTGPAGVADPTGAAVETPPSGFVLVLDDVTAELAAAGARDRLLHQLTEGSRGALGNLQAAVELLDDPGLDAATRERFLGVIRDEVRGLARRVAEASAQGTLALKTRWPLQDMLGADLAAAAARRIEARHRCRVVADEVDAGLWLQVDSFSLLQALDFLADRLVDAQGLKLLRLRLQAAGERAQLDLVWSGPGLSTETVVGWETEAMAGGGDGAGAAGTLALTLRDVVERHGGAFWFERERVRHEACFRFLLPLSGGAAAASAVQQGAGRDSRPEFYDFDLFSAARDLAPELADRPLAALSFTVFDTETTGLEPSGGDQILQVGATRIVAGKLRRQECFDQLVDPGRPVPAAGIPIHGITSAMVRGQPAIDRVLPAFHGFAADSVLVAHNAAFDMRFLQLQEEATGVRFEQPVLDTLLLSAVLHPNQPSHRLEAIAERLGVVVLGRHTALGDAMVTAEVFLKLIPLLEAAGIVTLGQALGASRKSYLARLSY